MSHPFQSAGGRASSDSEALSGRPSLAAVDAAAVTSDAKLPGITPQTMPLRAGWLSCGDLIDLYMAHYAGRDTSRTQRLAWWRARIGDTALQDLSDDHVHAALESLAQQRPRYFAGKDADGEPILKAKQRRLSGATINRYSASLAAVITWAIRRRIAPKGFVHPCRGVERQKECDGKTRFLSLEERTRLLEACKASKWPRLYALVLLALTTGARKGELVGLRWADVALESAVAHCGRTKNGDPKVLPLVPAVVEELRRFVASPSTHVFESTARKGQPFNFEAKFADALTAAKVKEFRFHDLRHSCASMLASSGATLLEIGDVLGHRQLAMTRRYSHLTTQHKAALVNRVLGDIR